MSRSRRTSRSSAYSPTRVGRDVVKKSPSLTPTLPRHSRLRRIDLRVFEDLRTNYPTRVRPAFSLPRSSSRLVIRNVNKPLNRGHVRVFEPTAIAVGAPSLTSRVAFSEPRSVVVCARRHRRREVLFALGVGGSKGLSRNRKVHRNEWSEIGC